jgi:hypothetical protein
MSAHAAVLEPPISSVRRPELSATGLQGRRVSRRDRLREELRDAFLKPSGKHRVTFVPLGND